MNRFWVADLSHVGSWIWRSLMNLRDTARPFIVFDVISGRNASFWHDNWTHTGPLLSRRGPLGPMVSGIPLNAFVKSVVGENRWSVSSRSRNSTLVSLRAALPAQIPDISERRPFSLEECSR